MIASGSSNAYEALMKHSDGSFLPVEITNVNINEKECLAIVRDITDSPLSARGLPRLTGWLRSR